MPWRRAEVRLVMPAQLPPPRTRRLQTVLDHAFLARRRPLLTLESSSATRPHRGRGHPAPV